MELDDDEAEFVKSLDLLSYKPVIYAANVSEDDASEEDNEYVRKVREFAETEGSDVIVVLSLIHIYIVSEEDIKTDFKHANELAIEVQRKCSDNLEILGACYPEGHYESRSLDEDIQNLKYKIGAGVKVLITQLFFDNQVFYEFVGKARLMGIDVPVSAGIMPIVNSRQIEKTVALSGASLPHKFTKMIGPVSYTHLDVYKRQVKRSAEE